MQNHRQTGLTRNQVDALEYLCSTGRLRRATRLSTWLALYDAGAIKGPRCACYATDKGRAIVAKAAAQ